MPRRPSTRKHQLTEEAQGVLAGATLDEAVPLRDQIYTIVRRAIVSGTLSPGAVVDDQEIARALGRSRTPVREAIKKLSDEGLVDVRAQSGTYVAEINRPQVEEAYIVRIALERQSVTRAAPLMNADHVVALETIIDRHSAALGRGRFDEAIAHDDDFHRYITRISGLTMLWKVVDTCKAQMDRCRIQTVPRPGHGSTTIDQHRAIVAGLSTRRLRPAVQALDAHLTTSLNNTLTWFAERDKSAD